MFKCWEERLERVARKRRGLEGTGGWVEVGEGRRPEGGVSWEGRWVEGPPRENQGGSWEPLSEKEKLKSFAES